MKRKGKRQINEKGNAKMKRERNNIILLEILFFSIKSIQDPISFFYLFREVFEYLCYSVLEIPCRVKISFVFFYKPYLPILQAMGCFSLHSLVSKYLGLLMSFYFLIHVVNQQRNGTLSQDSRIRMNLCTIIHDVK